ncbi:putative clathrin assembly protein At1g03050 [Punica granatum]|uniref:Clathrin assembly protein At1g03050 n=4 Tax=Punica granatum TaxID=22663 RepID=A0A6P8CKI8_PUNGR|nr:putative clathrin assembly protein At1g03050 [Punica granatum]
MAPSKLRKAIGAVKDQTSISLAKVGNSSSLSDLDVAIVKATRHEEFPADERHIREILSLTCYSRAHISACVNTLSRRLSKTKNWVVALKSLVLIHRLLADGDPAYEEEIFFSTRRGTRLLNMSDFRDTSRSNAWDYSAFVRTFALYLDERLDYRMQGRRGKRSTFGLDEEEEEAHQPHKATPVREMKVEQMFSKMHHLQQILDRFLACKPTGGAKNNRIVFLALYSVVKESFQIYHEIVELMAIFVDRFMEMDIPESVKVYEMFTRIGKQFDELDSFYAWSKDFGIARPSDYPEVEKITQKRLDIMDELIRDKTALAEGKKEKKKGNQTAEKVNTSDQLNNEPEAEQEEDPNATKALPAPVDANTNEAPEEKPDKEEEPKEEDKETVQQEADLLNLGDDAVTSEEHADKLALALFDGDGAPTASSGPSPLAWEAFPSGSADWENALVQSASNLQNQNAALGGGFDMTLLDGMYQQGAIAQAGANYGGSGSASSVALGSAGRPAMLALPAPPAQNGGTTTPGGDPFAASLAVAPPAYVQMSEMEKKQKLLMDEQLMWQQYAGLGRQGQIGAGHPYNAGVYTRQY